MLRLILLLVVAVAVAGYFLDWFTFEKGKNAEGKTKFELVVDDEKIDEDAAKAKEAAKDLAGRAADGAATVVADGTIEGTVAAVDRVAGWLSVRGGDGELVELRIDGDVKVKRDGQKASLDDVAVGATARVLFVDKDGVRNATRILLDS